MAKGGGSKGGGYSSFKINSSTSSFRVAPTPRPVIHNNIFTHSKPTTPITTTTSKPTIPTPTSKPTTPIPPSSIPPPLSIPSTSSGGGGFLATMMNGFSFGTGSSIGNNVVNRLFSSSPSPSPSSSSTQDCKDLFKNLEECLQTSEDVRVCQKVLKDYEACKNRYS
jgi:hypothetical protein